MKRAFLAIMATPRTRCDVGRVPATHAGCPVEPRIRFFVGGDKSHEQARRFKTRHDEMVGVSLLGRRPIELLADSR